MKPLIAARERTKSSVTGCARAGQVKNVHKTMAAIATAKGTNPPALSEKHKKLLDRQALLIETIQDFGRNVSSASNTQTPGKSAPKKIAIEVINPGASQARRNLDAERQTLIVGQEMTDCVIGPTFVAYQLEFRLRHRIVQQMRFATCSSVISSLVSNRGSAAEMH